MVSVYALLGKERELNDARHTLQQQTIEEALTALEDQQDEIEALARQIAALRESAFGPDPILAVYAVSAVGMHRGGGMWFAEEILEDTA